MTTSRSSADPYAIPPESDPDTVETVPERRSPSTTSDETQNTTDGVGGKPPDPFDELKLEEVDATGGTRDVNVTDLSDT